MWRRINQTALSSCVYVNLRLILVLFSIGIAKQSAPICRLRSVFSGPNGITGEKKIFSRVRVNIISRKESYCIRPVTTTEGKLNFEKRRCERKILQVNLVLYIFLHLLIRRVENGRESLAT